MVRTIYTPHISREPLVLGRKGGSLPSVRPLVPPLRRRPVYRTHVGGGGERGTVLRTGEGYFAHGWCGSVFPLPSTPLRDDRPTLDRHVLDSPPVSTCHDPALRDVRGDFRGRTYPPTPVVPPTPYGNTVPTLVILLGDGVVSRTVTTLWDR